MFNNKKWLATLLALGMALTLLAGCGSGPAASPAPAEKPPEKPAESLSGKSLFVYCGAGMTKPFGEIAEAFKAESGAEVEVVYANAAQIQTQIKTTQEGDLFIAGSVEELNPVKDVVAGSKELVKHVPVLAVKSGNPLKITGLKDLTKKDVEVVLGDAEATPIGKIANKALTDLGVLAEVNVIARTATAPEMITALSVDQCDAIIVWKENVSGSGIEIVNTTDLDAQIKKIPAATLSFSKNTETTAALLKFFDTDQAKSIWEKYGYEVVK
ncbi:molybdate ABC transporter substrate-binding protein [Desulfitobacterium chlororespirans]|uniref:Molybdate transport system substrate-binding protein n=1 Tax=Desulfitobacterium chlororespirans DSM 11544 TaxID=1121395 RepID=A0A1M7TX01_9FIRM|nr:molybdate ABC transporter substrate-binding protein [Desulfitobacterium chlororespirans]SHN75274.1 molybdate transport system substrate-binding protein [Desulfitobacterium chlororespirans DSM 11544]